MDYQTLNFYSKTSFFKNFRSSNQLAKTQILNKLNITLNISLYRMRPKWLTFFELSFT